MMRLMDGTRSTFLSTLSLRRATLGIGKSAVSKLISIHALLAESDAGTRTRPPRQDKISIHALLAESDSAADALARSITIFLSTLSLRRATLLCLFLPFAGHISIHALLAESDLKV